MFGVQYQRPSRAEATRWNKVAREVMGRLGGYTEVNVKEGTALSINNGRYQGWFVGPNRGEPFDSQAAEETLRRCGLYQPPDPNYRCTTYGRGTFVEVPRHYRQTTAPEVAEIIARLISESGKEADIYAGGVAEAFDNHRLRMRGYLIPIAAWDAAFRPARLG